MGCPDIHSVLSCEEREEGGFEDRGSEICSVTEREVCIQCGSKGKKIPDDG